MKNLCYSVLALLLLAISSCKKEDPKPETGAMAGTPVFSFTGNVNGNPIALQAGANDYFMSTSYSLDSNGVYDFIGELKPKNCIGDCRNSLKISIKDYRQFSMLPTTIDSTMVPGYYAFATPSGAASQYNNIFIATLKNGNAQSNYNWDFGDGTPIVTSTDSTVVHKYLHPGIYKVSLNETGCSSAIANDIQFGQTGNSLLPKFTTVITGDSAVFIPTPPFEGIYPYTYFWNFGDGSTSTATSPSHKYSAAGVYKASLTMTDATDTSAVQYFNVSIKPNTICSSNFSLRASTSLSNPMNLGDVVIEWRDTAGKLWTSKNNDQSPSKSMFKIISVENYLNSPNGDATKKIHVKFSCTLYSGSSSITMNNVEGIFAVSYK